MDQISQHNLLDTELLVYYLYSGRGGGVGWRKHIVSYAEVLLTIETSTVKIAGQAYLNGVGG